MIELRIVRRRFIDTINPGPSQMIRERVEDELQFRETRTVARFGGPVAEWSDWKAVPVVEET